MSIDSGATTHAFTKENTGINNGMMHINLPFSNITKTPNGVKVMYPDGNTAQATHEAVLNLPILPIAARKVRTVPYWDWSETPTTEEPISKSAMIEMILKGESIRQMLTCESIGKHESQHRHRRSKETAPQIKPTHCNSMYDSDSYFYFPSYQEDKEAIISRILLEEGRRQVLLTDTIVENLVSQSALEETKEEPVTRNIDGAQNSYWAW
jgi:hypothetical protein